MKRRTFLEATGFGTAGLLLPTWTRAQGVPGTNALNIPGLLTGEMENGRRHYRLQAQRGTSRFFSDLNTPTLGYNGNYLGPTIRLRDGEDVTMHVHNALGEPTTTHWHGLHVPASADGGPHIVIEAGTTWSPEFQVMEHAGTFWYHSHLIHKTGEQVYQGLAGMIIVDDAASENLPLPWEYGVDDIPLVIQDRRFNEDGSFQYLGAQSDIMTGMFGNYILVNGTLDPYFVPTTTKVRFRLLNGSNARTYNLAFSDGRTFQQLSCDGGFLDSTFEMRVVELGPAERCDIVVDVSDGNPVNLISLPMAADSPYMPRGMMRNMHPTNTERLQILALRPQSGLTHSVDLPSQLVPLVRFEERGIDNTRRFTLSMAMGMGGRMMRGGGGGGGRGGMMGRGGDQFFINNQAMDMSVVNESIPMGSTEIWEIVNDSMMMHPFHVHHGQFQVMDRNGRPVHAHERGYKDTVKVGPGETVRIVMTFDHFADPELPYMFHCHILEHEDHGMMGQFVVV
ncbi:MAG: multicopper oxidase domain-containing protein [Gammaproteobacteria bacterium]